MLQRSTFLPRTALTALLVLALLTFAVPAAGAASVRVKVRVEGLGGTIAPATTIDVPGPATFSDDSPEPGPNSATFATPVAMGALAVLADTQVFPFTTNGSMTYVNSIAGVGGLTSWWLYCVNGWYPDVFGMSDLVLKAGDSVVVYEVDAAAPWSHKQLVVRVAPRRGLLPGQAVTISVVGDDLAKANTDTDAERWKLDPVADVETAAQFSPVTGATLHVGRRVYDLDPSAYTDGRIVIADLPLGTYKVWAEKAPAASFNYVRSAAITINVDETAGISSLRVSPSPYRAGRRMVVRFRLDKAAKVGARIINARGRVVARIGARSLQAGARSLVWSGRTGVALTARLTVKLQTVDSWGRVATATRGVRVTR